MKNYLLIAFLITSLSGCGSGDSKKRHYHDAFPQSVSQPTAPQTPLLHGDNLTVEFIGGDASGSGTRKLVASDNQLYRASGPFRVSAYNRQNTVKVIFNYPPFVANPDTALFLVRYGCRDGLRGDLYFMNAPIEEIGAQTIDGRLAGSVTLTDLQSAFTVCDGRPVSIGIKFYTPDAATLQGTVQFYISSVPTHAIN